MATDPHWTQYFSALLAPIVAVFASLVAYWQWKLARNKLKLELFDRRLVVYEAAKEILFSIVTNDELENEDFSKFVAATREARWLFNKSVNDYLISELRSKAFGYIVLGKNREEWPSEESWNEWQYKRGQIKIWCADQFDVLDELFSPFLHLDGSGERNEPLYKFWERLRVLFINSNEKG